MKKLFLLSLILLISIKVGAAFHPHPAPHINPGVQAARNAQAARRRRHNREYHQKSTFQKIDTTHWVKYLDSKEGYYYQRVLTPVYIYSCKEHTFTGTPTVITLRKASAEEISTIMRRRWIIGGIIGGIFLVASFILYKIEH